MNNDQHPLLDPFMILGRKRSLRVYFQHENSGAWDRCRKTCHRGLQPCAGEGLLNGIILLSRHPHH